MSSTTYWLVLTTWFFAEFILLSWLWPKVCWVGWLYFVLTIFSLMPFQLNNQGDFKLSVKKCVVSKKFKNDFFLLIVVFSFCLSCFFSYFSYWHVGQGVSWFFTFADQGGWHHVNSPSVKLIVQRSFKTIKQVFEKWTLENKTVSFTFLIFVFFITCFL